MVFRLKEWPVGRLRRLAEVWPDPTWAIQAMARELGVDDDAVLRRAKAVTPFHPPALPGSFAPIGSIAESRQRFPLVVPDSPPKSGIRVPFSARR